MKRSELFFSGILVPLDYAVLLLAALVSYQIRYLPIVTSIRPVAFDLSFRDYLLSAALFALAWLVIFSIAGLYRIQTRSSFGEMGRIILACSSGIALVMATMFFSRFLFDSRFIILVCWILSMAFVMFERKAVRLIQTSLYYRGIGVHRVVLIGNGEAAVNLAREFSGRSRLGYQVVGEFNELDDATKSRLAEMAQHDKFDEIILTNANWPRHKMLEMVDLTHEWHRDFKYVADLLGTKVIRFEIDTYGYAPVIEIKRTPLDGWGKIIKLGFDCLIAALLLVLFSPLMLLAALAIRLDSRGPIFFRYQRVGERGKVIDFIKFRTMVVGAHQLRYNRQFQQMHKNIRGGTPMVKFVNDPRVTRVGKFLRRWSIDEMPQLFLVLSGKMSLVGPRPHEIEEVASYNRFQKQVLTVKPGITGLAQVSGRSDLDFNEEVKLDIYYIENWSLALDFKILTLTPRAVIQKRQTL